MFGRQPFWCTPAWKLAGSSGRKTRHRAARSAASAAPRLGSSGASKSCCGVYDFVREQARLPATRDWHLADAAVVRVLSDTALVAGAVVLVQLPAHAARRVDGAQVFSRRHASCHSRSPTTPSCSGVLTSARARRTSRWPGDRAARLLLKELIQARAAGLGRGCTTPNHALGSGRGARNAPRGALPCMVRVKADKACDSRLCGTSKCVARGAARMVRGTRRAASPCEVRDVGSMVHQAELVSEISTALFLGHTAGRTGRNCAPAANECRSLDSTTARLTHLAAPQAFPAAAPRRRRSARQGGSCQGHAAALAAG